jgi:hypothetical protein
LWIRTIEGSDKMITCNINTQQYQMTKPMKNGIAQKVIPELHTLYNVKIEKNYFDCENKIEVLKSLQSDLEELCSKLDIEIGEEYKKVLKRTLK